MFNKALNDMVHVSRAFAGLPRLADAAEVGTPTTARGWRACASLVRFLPVQPDLPLVEMTILAFLAAVGDVIVGGLAVTRGLLVAMLALAVPTVVGHVLAILSSTKLRTPAAG